MKSERRVFTVARDASYFYPNFIPEGIDYGKWLKRKSNSHYRRDIKRGLNCDHYSVSDIRKSIHKAVWRSKGKDEYTGKILDWNLIGKYDNNESKLQKSMYRKSFYNLPTVDHSYNKNDPIDFYICSWRVNDAKNDLNLCDFIKLCSDILDYSKKT